MSNSLGASIRAQTGGHDINIQHYDLNCFCVGVILDLPRNECVAELCWTEYMDFRLGKVIRDRKNYIINCITLRWSYLADECGWLCSIHGRKENFYKILLRNTNIWRRGCGWEKQYRIDCKKIQCNNMKCIPVNPGTVRWWSCENAATKLTRLHELREQLLAGRSWFFQEGLWFKAFFIATYWAQVQITYRNN
jgi:hypothetical protein